MDLSLKRFQYTTSPELNEAQKCMGLFYLFKLGPYIKQAQTDRQKGVPKSKEIYLLFDKIFISGKKISVTKFQK